MAQEPVKPINELEKKTWVSDQDLILILDAETNEARLAPKEELRWDPGGKGENWEQWVGIAEITQKRDWKKVSVVIKKNKSSKDINYKAYFKQNRKVFWKTDYKWGNLSLKGERYASMENRSKNKQTK